MKATGLNSRHLRAVALALMMSFVHLSGCSIYMAATQPPNKQYRQYTFHTPPLLPVSPLSPFFPW
jgi:hypothetical protein